MPSVESAVSTRTFVLGLIHRDGRVLASEVHDIGAVAGFTVHQLRLCLARLVNEGVFIQEGRGRRAVLTLTESSRRIIESEPGFLRLAFDQDDGLAPWDGTWHLLTFSIGEDRRTARNELRARLTELGGAALGGGVYVSAIAWDDLVLDVAGDLDVVEDVTVAVVSRLRVGREDDPRRLAERLWPLADLAQGWSTFVDEYAAFVDELVATVDHLDDVSRVLAGAIALVAAFDRSIRHDPLLPPELLPDDWPGREGRRLLLRAAGAMNELRRADGLPGLFGRYDAVIGDVLQRRSGG